MTDLRVASVADGKIAPSDSLGFELRASQFWLQPRIMWAAPPAASSRPEVGRRAPAVPNPTAARTPTAGPARRRGGSRAGAARTAAIKPKGAQGGTEAAPLGTRIGVISDNHGYLDGAILEIFAGVSHVIHAGDIMDPEILSKLETVAPVTAVSGNMDSPELASLLPREAAGEVAGVRFVVGHKRKRLLKSLAAGGIAGLDSGAQPDLVVYGHDHIPQAAWVDGTLYLNPGSATAPHEEDDGPTVAIVEVRPGGLGVTFVPLSRTPLGALADG